MSSKSSTTLKHRIFTGEPMGDKKITEIPGIGPVAEKKFAKHNYNFAYQIFGEYLILKKDVEVFSKFLSDIGGMNAPNIKNCVESIETWSDSFF